jgi:outer membrane protein assembly factor BamA
LQQKKTLYVFESLKTILPFILFLFTCIHQNAGAQLAKVPNIVFSEVNGEIIPDKTLKKTKISYTTESAIQQKLLQLFANGYLAARVEKLTTIDSINFVCYLNIGNKYKWAKIARGNVDEEILSQIGFREKIYFNQDLNFSEIEDLGIRLLTYCENNGYPFASFNLDSLSFPKSDVIEASLNLNKNKFIKIDSITIIGNAKISPAYLYNYIGIKPGDPYNESLFLKISARIKEMPFVKETRPHEMVFTEGASKLIFHLTQKQANKFDGILGLLPDDNTPGKILITGEIQLKLLNSFGNGELIDINWRKLQNETQDLRTQLVYPFLLSSPFGLDLKFDLYKRDTTFLNINPNIGLQYMLKGGNYFKVFLNQKSSRILSNAGLESLSHLPPYADISTTLYGIGIKFEEFDYRFNPRKGYKIAGNAAAGNRNILKNRNIKDEFYEGIELKTVQYDINIVLDYFIPLTKRSTFKLSNYSAMLINKNAFENELYRIGGLKTIRGFDEESIFASSFSIFTAEARYLLEQNSFAHVFWNGAWYENNSNNNLISSLPWGFGAGIGFETKAGIFSFSYALGKQFDNPFQLRSGKIHFGILNYF